MSCKLFFTSQIDIIAMSAGVIRLSGGSPATLDAALQFLPCLSTSPAILLKSSPSGITVILPSFSCRLCSDCRAAYPSYLKSISASSHISVGTQHRTSGKILHAKIGPLEELRDGTPLILVAKLIGGQRQDAVSLENDRIGFCSRDLW